MKTPGQFESDAIAASIDSGYVIFYRKRQLRGGRVIYDIFRRLPGGFKVSLIRKTTSAETLARTIRAAARITTKPNPSPRLAEAGARQLVTAFTGRMPAADEYESVPMPKIDGALAAIGKIVAIEYLAERDGKVYCFRHKFKVRSRPALAVSQDGSFVTMLGGAWRFTEDGFVDA